MTYLLSTAVILLVAVTAGTGALLYLATRDVAATEDMDDDDDEGVATVYVDDDDDDCQCDCEGNLPLNVEPYVNLFPPFRILYLGRSGEHDVYPITPQFRQSFVDFLDRSWSLPCAARCSICWSPVDGNQCHLHESDA